MARLISKNCLVFLLGGACFLSAAVLFMLTGRASWPDLGTVVYRSPIPQSDYKRMDSDRHNERHTMPTVYRAKLGVGDEEINVTGFSTLQDQAAFVPNVHPKSRLCTPISKPRPAKGTPSGVKIIILASMRTGSSFVGEMLGQNSDIFYLFEPGLLLEILLRQSGTVFLQPLYLDLLNRLYQCTLNSYGHYIKWLSTQGPTRLLRNAPRMYEKLCAKSGNHSKCGKVTPELFMSTCRDLNKVVIKSIRVIDIGSLSPLIQDMNLKVIHLVRDPRGMIASWVLAMNKARLTAEKVEEFTNATLKALTDYCWRNLHNMDSGTILPRFRDNYLLLRYEDVSLDPHEAAGRIYNFTGLGAVPENVSKWIREHTSAHVAGTYSTSRVSSEVYQAWRTELNYTTIKTIEDVGTCSQMMQRFGYFPAKDQGVLTDLNISLLSDKLPDVKLDIYDIYDSSF